MRTMRLLAALVFALCVPAFAAAPYALEGSRLVGTFPDTSSLPAAYQHAGRTVTVGTTPPFVQYVSDGVTWNPVGSGTSTDTSTTAGVTTSALGNFVQTYQPSSTSSSAIRFGQYQEMHFAGANALTGTGHVGARIDRMFVDGTANPNLAIAHEAKVDVTNAGATVTTANGVNVQLASNAGTITNFVGVTSQIIGNAGTIGTAILHGGSVANTGTIGLLYGNYFPDLSGVSGITSKWAFVNDDAGAPIRSKAPIFSNATYRATPTTGQTVTVPLNTRRVVLTPAGTLASLTIALPSASALGSNYDGQQITIFSSQTITSLTVTCSGAAFVLAPSTMGSSKAVVLEWDNALTFIWTVSN